MRSPHLLADNAVPTLVSGFVEQHPSPLQNLPQIIAPGGLNHAGAQREEFDASLPRQPAPLDRLPQSLSDRQPIVEHGSGQQYGECIIAQPRNTIHITERGRYELRHDLQDGRSSS